MTFVQPGLLYALPLIAVPILLHWLLRRRADTVLLSTYRFLLDAVTRQRRRMRWRDALLAALRTLVILALVLAMARPTFQRWQFFASGGSGKDHVVLIDLSASMMARTKGFPAIVRAKHAASEIIDRLASTDRLIVMGVAARPVEVFHGFSLNGARPQRAVAELQPRATGANVRAAIVEALSACLAAPTSMAFITDGQAASWDEIKRQGVADLIPKETELAVIDVGARSAIPNVAIQGTAPIERPVLGLPMVLSPRVVNYGDSPVRAAVAVLVDNQEVGHVDLDLKGRSAASGTVIFTPRDAGPHEGRFELVAPRDGFAADDVFRFPLQIEPHVGILLVDGSPGTDPSECDITYVRAVLRTWAEGRLLDRVVGTGDASRSRPAIEIRESIERTLRPASFDNMDLVVLANCGGSSAYRSRMLADFMESGGGLLMFPGARVVPARINAQFVDYASREQAALSSVRLDSALGDRDHPAEFTRIVALDRDHPAWSGFADRATDPLRTTAFYRRFPLRLEDASAGNRVLAEFADHRPALVESHLGSGRAVLAGFPLIPQWSNLPMRPDFVPLLLGLSNYARRAHPIEAPVVTTAGNALTVQLPLLWSTADGFVHAPDGSNTALEFVHQAKRLRAVTPMLESAGNYHIDVHGHVADGAQDASALFAVNVAPSESDFTVIREPELRALLPGVRLRYIDASTDAEQADDKTVAQPEIWRLAIGLLLVLFMIEFILATPGVTAATGERAGIRKVWNRLVGTAGTPHRGFRNAG